MASFGLGLGAKFGPKFATALKGMGSGAAIGGFSSSLNELTDDAEGFDLSEVMKDSAIGGAFGLAGGGLKGLLGKREGLGRIAGGTGKLMAAGYPWGERVGQEGAESPSQGVGFGGMPLGASGATSSLGVDFGGDPFGLGAPPSYPTMTMGDYLRNPRLNKIVDNQLAMQINPINRQIEDINADKAIDLSTNESLGQNLQNQMSQVARDHKNNVVAINGAASDAAERTSEDVELAREQAGAGEVGDDYTRQQLAEENAANEARIADRRMADSELLRRLGVTGDSALSEIQAAEAQQTGQNSLSIKNAANKSVRQAQGQINDLRLQRPSMLNDIAQQHYDTALQKFQGGLSVYQTKLAAAKSNADLYKSQMEIQAMQGGGGQEMSAEMYNGLMGSSGRGIPNEETGGEDKPPRVAIMSEQEVAGLEQQYPGMGFYSTWLSWNRPEDAQ